MVYSFLYILITAIAVNLVHIIGNNMPDMLMLFLSISFAIIVFNLINYKTTYAVHLSIIKEYKWKYLKLNMALLIMSGGSFLIPIYFLPSEILIPYMGILCSCGSIGRYLLNKNKVNFIKAILIITTLIYFYFLHYLTFSHTKFLIFLASTLITGLGGFSYLKISALFSRDKFSASQILAVRFWMIWGFSLVYAIKQHQFSGFRLSMLPATLLAASLSLIIPVYFSQKSVEKIGANLFSMLMGLIPLVVVFLQSFILHQPLISDIWPAIFIALIITTFPTLKYFTNLKVRQ